MNTWLAIVVFCIQGECAFMVSSKQVLPTARECADKVGEYLTILKDYGADMTLPTCIYLKYKIT